MGNTDGWGLEGAVTGTATFDNVIVQNVPDEGKYRVTGQYQDTETIFETHEAEIAGITIENISGELELTPTGDTDCLWVEAADDNILRITQTKPDTA